MNHSSQTTQEKQQVLSRLWGNYLFEILNAVIAHAHGFLDRFTKTMVKWKMVKVNHFLHLDF
jgi:DNA topoisomerase VI subunit A